MSDQDFHNCPCCSFPTLPERNGYFICRICWWEDEHEYVEKNLDATTGPNRDYSLRHARRNFYVHGHMYDPGDAIDVVKTPSPARKALLDYVFAVIAQNDELDVTRLHALMAKTDDDL